MNREYIVWRPDQAGGDWPRRAREAAAGLAGRAEEEDPASSLLSDIHIEFKTLKVDRIHSKVLVMELNKLPGRPWAGRSKGADADMRWLLSPLGAPASRWRF